MEVTLHFDCSLWLNLSFYFLTDLQDFLFDSIITFLLYIILIKKLTLNHFLVFNDNLSNNTRFSSISHNPEKEINIRIPALIRSFILYDIHRFIAISRTHNTPFKHGGCCSRNRWLFVAHSKCEHKTIIWCGLWKKVTSLRNNQGNFFFVFLLALYFLQIIINTRNAIDFKTDNVVSIYNYISRTMYYVFDKFSTNSNMRLVDYWQLKPWRY